MLRQEQHPYVLHLETDPILQVVEILLAAGANLNTADAYGVTPICIATHKDTFKLWRCCLQLELTGTPLTSMEQHPSLLQLRMEIIKLWICYLRLELTRMLLMVVVEHAFLLQHGMVI